MKYFMKMGGSLSDSFYQHSDLFSIFGTGQGNGTSAPIWLFTSVFLMKVLGRLHCGMEFCSPDGLVTSSCPINAIVDDTMVGTNKGQTHTQVLENAQSLAQTWADLLWLSGGALELSKCYYYSVQWSWVKGRAVMDRFDPFASIAIQQSDVSDPLTITQKPTNEGMRTLGVHVSPSGCLKQELNHLISKACQISVGFLTEPLTHEEWRKAVRAICLPRLSYSLAVTHFKRAELETIQAKYIPALLQAGRLHSCLPRAVVFAPQYLGCPSVDHLFFLQGLFQVKLFIGLSRIKSDLSDLFHIGLDYFRLHAGLGHCPMAKPRLIPYLPHDWFVSVMEALVNAKVSINTSPPKYFSLKCVHDRNLMEVILEQEYPSRIIEAFNRCRVYVRAICLSNITDPSGRCLVRKFFLCEDRLTSILEWPCQAWPSKHDRKVWKNLLLQNFSFSAKFLTLQQPLGPWIADPELHHWVWRARISKDITYCYVKCGGYWL